MLNVTEGIWISDLFLEDSPICSVFYRKLEEKRKEGRTSTFKIQSVLVTRMTEPKRTVAIATEGNKKHCLVVSFLSAGRTTPCESSTAFHERTHKLTHRLHAHALTRMHAHRHTHTQFKDKAITQ